MGKYHICGRYFILVGDSWKIKIIEGKIEGYEKTMKTKQVQSRGSQTLCVNYCYMEGGAFDMKEWLL